jgi:hypothetical protein
MYTIIAVPLPYQGVVHIDTKKSVTVRNAHSRGPAQTPHEWVYSTPSEQAPVGRSWIGGEGGTRARFRDSIVEPSDPCDAPHRHPRSPPSRRYQNAATSSVQRQGVVVSAPPEPPLAAALAPVLPALLVDLHMEVGGEGCACGPSGSRRKFDWCGPPGVNASLVVWWRTAAGIGEAVTMAVASVPPPPLWQDA